MSLDTVYLRKLLAHAAERGVVLPLRRSGPDSISSEGGYAFDIIRYQSYSHHYEHSKNLVVAAVNALPELLDALDSLKQQYDKVALAVDAARHEESVIREDRDSVVEERDALAALLQECRQQIMPFETELHRRINAALKEVKP